MAATAPSLKKMSVSEVLDNMSPHNPACVVPQCKRKAGQRVTCGISTYSVCSEHRRQYQADPIGKAKRWKWATAEPETATQRRATKADENVTDLATKRTAKQKGTTKGGQDNAPQVRAGNRSRAKDGGTAQGGKEGSARRGGGTTQGVRARRPAKRQGK